MIGDVVLSNQTTGILVNTSADSTFGDGLCSFREAIDVAHLGANVDSCTNNGVPSEPTRIYFAESDMHLQLSYAGIENLNSSGDLDLFPAQPLEIFGCEGTSLTGPRTILQGNADIVYVENCDTTNPSDCISFPSEIQPATGSIVDRVLHIHSNTEIYIEDLMIQNSAIKDDFGGAIYNEGNLTLVDTWISNTGSHGESGLRGRYGSSDYDSGKGGGGAGGAGAGLGGAIYNASSAELYLQSDNAQCLFTDNNVIGGLGARAGFHQSSYVSASSTYGGDGGGPNGGIGTSGSSCNAPSGGFASGGAGGPLLCIGGTGGFGGGGGGGGASNYGGNTANGGAGGFGGGNGGVGCCSAGSGGGGGAGFGGAIFNDSGFVSIIDCSFEQNTAIGGLGGSNWYGGRGGSGSGMGGAIFNYMGEISISNGIFMENHALGARSSSGFNSSGEGYGGAIFNYQGTLSESNITHINNVAETLNPDLDEEP